MSELWMQWARAIYYLVGFDRAFPGKTNLAAAIQAWELRHHKGDSPKPQADWDTQYACGSWSYLGQLDETSRYGTIVGYLAALAPHGDILDVGCGDGVLYQRLRCFGYGSYVGIDLSEVAIAKLINEYDWQTTFARADAERYKPDRAFDAIVFNEVLYYLHDPLATLQRYLKSLKPNGAAIVSLYTSSRRARVITAQIRKHLNVRSETITRQDSKEWVCLVVCHKV